MNVDAVNKFVLFKLNSWVAEKLTQKMIEFHYNSSALNFITKHYIYSYV